MTRRNHVAQNMVRSAKTAVKLRFSSVGRNRFAQNEVRISKAAGKLLFWVVRRNSLCVKAPVCKRVCVSSLWVSKPLCVKASVWKSACVCDGFFGCIQTLLLQQLSPSYSFGLVFFLVLYFFLLAVICIRTNVLNASRQFSSQRRYMRVSWNRGTAQSSIYI